MADGDSVGKISLDMEVDGDLSKQIGEAANKIGDQVKASLSNIGNFDFKGMANTISKSIEKSIESSMKNIQSSIEKSLNKALSNAMNAIKKFKIPVEFDIPKNFSMPKMNYKVSMAQPRAPPTAKVNTGINVEALKAQIDNLTQSLDITNAKIEQQKAKLAELKESYNRAFNESRKNKLEEEILKTEAAINRLTVQSDKVGFKLADLDEQFAMLGDMAKSSTAGINEVAQSINKTSNSAAKASNNMKGLSNSTRSTGDSFRNSYGGMNMFFDSLFKWGIVFPMIISGLGTMASFLGSALMVNSQFANSLNLIKSNLFTAFMPIYNAVLPALNSLMSALVTATAYIASFISQLFGTTYNASFGAAQAMQSQIGAYTQAQKAAKQAATSLGTVGSSASSSSEKIKKASKEAKGSVAAFDEVNQLQLMKDPAENTPKTPKAGKPAGDGVITPIIPMPNMAPIETATAAWADKFKNILAGLWEPFKDAWAAEGVNTINAAKYALTGIESLIGAIGKSFYTVWTNGTGQRILENMLRILQDILNIIGSIAITFANAWNNGNIGTQVVQHLADAFNNILVLIDKMLQSLQVVWTQEGPTFANMFMQALNSVSQVIENVTLQMNWIWDHGGQHAFEGFVKLGLKIGELALFIFTNFVTPFVTWFVNMISPAIAKVLDWVGKLFDKMSQVITWLMGSGKPVLEVIIVTLGSFAVAWGAVTLAIKTYYGVQALVGAAQIKFNSVLALIKSPAGIAVLAITAIITVCVLLYKNWDTIKAKAKEVWDSVTATFKAFQNYLGNVFATDWSTRFGALGNILNGFLANVKNIWNSVRGIFNGIIDFIAGTFSGNWSRAWKGITEIFGNVFGGIVAIAKVPINGVISLINAAVTELDKIKVNIPDWVPQFGGKSFGVDIPKIPYLAQGGIVDRPTLSMVGEAGKEAVVPLENNTGGLKILADMLAQEIKGQLGVIKLGTSNVSADNISNVSNTKENNNDNSTGTEKQNQNFEEYGQSLDKAFGKGITDSTDAVTKTTTELSTNVTNIMNNLVKSFIKDGQDSDINLGIGITNSIDSVMNPLNTVISSMTTNIQKFIFNCIAFGQNVVLNLGNGINTNADALIRPLNNLINSSVVVVERFVQSCLVYGQNIDSNLGAGISDKIDVVVNAVNNVLTTIGNNIDTFVKGSVLYGQNMDTSISTGITNNLSEITDAVAGLTSKVGGILQTFANSCTSYGNAIVTELGSGIQASESNLSDIVKDLTDKVITQFKEGFGIHSPSRVMFIIGNYLMQGLINGMTATDVKAFINKWLGDITGAAGGNVSGWLTAALAITGTPMDWLPGLLNLTAHESGDPNIIGSGDPTQINSQAVGDEYATGLLQTLPSTFAEFALPGFDNIFNPIANAIAAIRYIKWRYGSVYNTPLYTSGGGVYGGYATGTKYATAGLHPVGEKGMEFIDFTGGEMVLNNLQSIKLLSSAANAINRVRNAMSSVSSIMSGLKSSINIATLKQPELSMRGEINKKQGPSVENTDFTDTLTTAIVNAILTAFKLNNNSQDANHIRDLILQIDGTTLARILKPYLDKENQRVGNKLILKTT